MDLFNRLKNTSGQLNCFSKSDTLGAFDFSTLTVSLDSLQTNDFDELNIALKNIDYEKSFLDRNLKGEVYTALSRIYGLAYHEYTHFLDATCTVWGLNYLTSLNEAYKTNHKVFGTLENEYHKAKSFYDLTRSFKLPDYYTAIEENVDFTKPWRYWVSVGRKFDYNGHPSEIPIPFVSFGNMKNERIVRSPLSIIAILEVSAMAQEFLYKCFLVNALPNGIRQVETAQLEKLALDFLFNRQLTEYTACAHLVANIQGFTDLLKSYTMCAKISTIVLNFTDDHFDKITFSPSARKKLHLDEDAAVNNSTKNAIKYKDRGFLFYLITLMLPRKKYEKDTDFIEGINYALQQMGHDYHTIITDARIKVEIMANELINSPFTSIRTISKSSRKNFEEKLKSAMGMYNFSAFDLPPVLLGDCSSIVINNNPNNSLSNYDLENAYDELSEGQKWVTNFSEACS